jgi:oligopeptide transport system permease protein
MKAQDYVISKEKFAFASGLDNLHDKALETKPISYFRDALNRFCKNKASILAAIIIGILFVFSMLGPILSPYTVSYEDVKYAFARPKISLFYDLGIPFWDGGVDKEVTQKTYLEYNAIEVELGKYGVDVFMDEPQVREELYMGKKKTYYNFRLNTYDAVGADYILLTTDQYKALQEYQDKNKVQIILPITTPSLRPTTGQDLLNGNIWYMTKLGDGNKSEIVLDKDGNYIPIYQVAEGSNIDDGYFSTMYWEGDTKIYNYAEPKDNNTNWYVRVNYREYYAYSHALKGDGIKEPMFVFGANHAGKDLFTCLASGARFSFILAILVSSVNLFVGAIYGAIEGYYGGKIDLLMERFVDIIGSIPFMIVITLLKYHFNVSHVIILFISFFLTGWTGMAGRTRMQFYRFKHQEYVLVARTLGANDRRIMFKHIFPNALGTLITGSVLIIPGVIFSETSLSYLNIIDLNTGDMTSVGTLLASGQEYFFEYPHTILSPAIFISLLMLSFNLFGNGLRDAFNPSLRGTE